VRLQGVAAAAATDSTLETAAPVRFDAAWLAARLRVLLGTVRGRRTYG